MEIKPERKVQSSCFDYSRRTFRGFSRRDVEVIFRNLPKRWCDAETSGRFKVVGSSIFKKSAVFMKNWSSHFHRISVP